MLGHNDEAVALAEQAWALRGREDQPVATRAESSYMLARALWAADPTPAGRRRARALAEQGRAGFAEIAHEGALADIDAWLAKHRL